MLLVPKTRSKQHMVYREEHRNKILISGGLFEESGSAFVGGLWVFEIESRECVVNLIENDSYFFPAYRAYRLLVW